MMKKIRVAIAGLGRLGRVHAENLAFRIPNAKLCAVCAQTEDSLNWARERLDICACYQDFAEMLAKETPDAVVLVTPSDLHCEQIELALAAGVHVFFEKPLGTDPARCAATQAAAEQHPELVCMPGFMRRYDKSYVYAKHQIDSGAIGTPYMMKCTGIDPESAIEGTLRVTGSFGGIFMDLGIHDVDLMRWLLGCEPAQVHAVGTTVKYPAFREGGDYETAAALYQFTNGAIGMAHAGRCSPYGYHVETEIIGTEGTLRISGVPAKNLTQLYKGNGAATECVGSFQERFEEAYLAEVQEFVDCVCENRRPAVTMEDAVKATAIAHAAGQALRSGEIIKL